jgi:3D (Asp-Asp-Asp) domain-containing protein
VPGLHGEIQEVACGIRTLGFGSQRQWVRGKPDRPGQSGQDRPPLAGCRQVTRALVAMPFVLLLFVAGVQVGIGHGRRLAEQSWIPVEATAYNSEVAQTDSTPSITASGTQTRVGVLAVSRDLLKLLPYGTTVYVVEDTMHPRWTRRLDFWMSAHRDAVTFGLRTGRLLVFEELRVGDQ